MPNGIYDLSLFAQMKLKEAQEAGLGVFLVDLCACQEHHRVCWVWEQPDIQTYHTFELFVEGGRMKLQTRLCANKDKDASGELVDASARLARDTLVSVFGPSTTEDAAA